MRGVRIIAGGVLGYLTVVVIVLYGSITFALDGSLNVLAAAQLVVLGGPFGAAFGAILVANLDLDES